MIRNNTRLQSLMIQGFKSVPDRHPIELLFGDVTILLGANGAGKSNIVSFFRMLGYMMSGRLQRFIAESGTNQKFLYYGAKKTSEIRATLTFETKDETEAYSFSLGAAVPDRLIVTSEEIDSRHADQTSEKISLKSDFNETALLNGSGILEANMLEWLSACKVFQFSDSSIMAPMRQASPIDSAHYLQSDAGNLASFLFFLKNNYPESFRRITEYVREVVPQFHEFYLMPERGYISLKWTDKSSYDYVLSADQLSDGSIRFIALATLLLQPEETMPLMIIIDEPELGLHPYAVDQLNEMIKDASHHAQIVMATQSTSIIDGFTADDVIVIERNPAIHGTTARKLSEKDYQDWLEEYWN